MTSDYSSTIASYCYATRYATEVPGKKKLKKITTNKNHLSYQPLNVTCPRHPLLFPQPYSVYLNANSLLRMYLLDFLGSLSL
jgi:hypothetical protein